MPPEEEISIGHCGRCGYEYQSPEEERLVIENTRVTGNLGKRGYSICANSDNCDKRFAEKLRASKSEERA